MREFKNYSELKKDPEARDYRDAMAKAIGIARKFDGSEAAYHDLFSALERVEEGILRSPSLRETIVTHRDAEAALAFAPKQPREIGDVLSLANESMQRVIHRAIEDPDESSALIMNRIPGVLLPPGNGTVLAGDEQKFEPARFEPRLQEVMKILKTLEIYSDDVILFIGDTPEGMMREVSYVVVDIPRLDRMILVCNQVGEATFVITGRVPVRTLLMTRKEDLSEIPAKHVAKVVRNSQWSDRLIRMLTHEIDDTVAARGAKVDVRAEDRDTLRGEFLHTYPTSKDLLNTYVPARGTYVPEVLGHGLIYLAKQFGISRTKTRKEMIGALIEVIYGPDDEALERFRGQDVEVLRNELRAEILQEYPTSREWMEGYRSKTDDKKEQWLNIKVKGHGLPWLAARFGVMERAKTLRIPDFIALGFKIYGADDSLLLSEKSRLERGEDEWRTRVLKEYPTSAEWMAELSRGGRGSVGGRVSIDRRGINYIAARFGFAIPITLRGFIELGLKMYGADDPLLKSELSRISLEGAEGWRPEIVKKYPTAADWIGEYRRSNQGRGIDVNGRGLMFLASQFGIEGDPRGIQNFIALSALIYGEDDPTVRRESERLFTPDPQVWRDEIRKKYPTSEAWMSAFRERTAEKGISVMGRSITSLARIFGISGPAQKLPAAIALGKQVYGEDDPILQELSQRVQYRQI